MSIQRELASKLDELAKQPDRNTTLSLQWDQDAVRLEVVEVNDIGCAFTALEYQSPVLESLDAQQLRCLGKKLAEQVNYLMEPIRVIEVDVEESTLQLRSKRPETRESSRRYYEILARPRALHLCRYEKSNGQKRQRVPAQLTREVLARLIGDFETVAKN